MVETTYGGLMAYGRLLDVALVICNKSWVSSMNCYPFESSMYEPIRDYHEFDEYSTYCIVRKFYNHAHMLVDIYMHRRCLGHRLWSYGETHFNYNI